MNCFDYGSGLYEDLVWPISRYSFFLRIEATHVAGLFDMEFSFHYRITDDRVIEIISGDRQDDSAYNYKIIGKFQLEEPFREQLLKPYIREYIWGGRNYFGLAYEFRESTIMSEEQFKELLDDIMADLRIGKHIQETKWHDAPIAKVCREYGLEILPSSREGHFAECRCHNHSLMINLESGSWFCGYCRKSGHVEEFREHVKTYIIR